MSNSSIQITVRSHGRVHNYSKAALRALLATGPSTTSVVIAPRSFLEDCTMCVAVAEDIKRTWKAADDSEHPVAHKLFQLNRLGEYSDVKLSTTRKARESAKKKKGSQSSSNVAALPVGGTIPSNDPKANVVVTTSQNKDCPSDVLAFSIVFFTQLSSSSPPSTSSLPAALLNGFNENLCNVQEVM
eukprot:PhM_4_TR9215/c0_g1_i3/m.105971